MDEKVKNFMDKVDMVTEKCNIIPKCLDNIVKLLRIPSIACIPTLINKVTSKFSLVTVALFALIYVIYCLKNMIVSLFFKTGPSGLAFQMALTAIVIALLDIYIIYKTNGIFDKIVASSPCRISSLNIFSIMTLIYLLLTVFFLSIGIYAAVIFKFFPFVIYGLAAAIFSFLLALFHSTPEEFAITEDENVSAGEDFTAIATFSVKVILRFVPIIIFFISIVGIILCFFDIFTFYTRTSGDSIVLQERLMRKEMMNYAWVLLIGLIPLIAYAYYLVSYVSLDLIRTVLSLPQKLDNLKK